MTIRNLEPWNFEQIQRSNENNQDLPRIVQNIETQQTPLQNNNENSEKIKRYRVEVLREERAYFDVYAKNSDDAELFAREKGWQARDEEFSIDDVIISGYPQTISNYVSTEDIEDELREYESIYRESLYSADMDMDTGRYFFGEQK